MEEKKYDAMCITGFVFGILGEIITILIFPEFCAIIFSCIGIARTETNGKKGSALAKWGLGLGIVAIIQLASKVISLSLGGGV